MGVVGALKEGIVGIGGQAGPDSRLTLSSAGPGFGMWHLSTNQAPADRSAMFETINLGEPMQHLHSFSILRIFVCLMTALVMLTVALALPGIPANAAAGINRYVSPAGSNAPDCTNAAAPCKTITYALGQSQAGDTLLLDAGVYSEHLVINKGIRIVQNPVKACPYLKLVLPLGLTLIPCATLDGGLNGRVIEITSALAEVSLEKLTIRNGQVTDGSGAGIRSQGLLTIDNVSLHSNHIIISDLANPSNYEFRGGAIDNQNQLTLRNSSMHDNSAYNGGGISSTGALLLVQNTNIFANNALHFGGGIWVPYGAPTTLENTTLYENSAVSSGGGMFIGNDGVPGNMGHAHLFRNVTISANTSSLGTGGLASYLQVNIDHSTLVLNSGFGNATDLDLTESQVYHGYGYLHSSITNTIVSHPSATLPLCAICEADSFVLSGGGNLSGDHSCDFTQPTDQVDTDPGLLPLAQNGGPVRTHALPFASPAIDHAGPYSLGADARGVVPQDGDLNGSVVPDSGAYEFTFIRTFLPMVRK